MIGRVIKPRVFLEGVEIPVYRVTVQTSIGAPSAAVLDIPPSEEFFERFEKDAETGEFIQKTGVLPRTLVHIFYEDSEDPDGVARLLFEGEFVKFEYSKTVDGRSIKLVARDISNLLTTAYVRYYGDFFTPYANLITAFTGEGTVDKPNPEQLRLAIVGATTGMNADVMEAIQNDKAGVGIAAAFRDIARKAGSFNTFFNEFELRTKISEKIVALPDTKSRLLLEATQLASLIKQNMANLKELSTVWDLYTMLMSLVFYFPVPISSAPFISKAIMQTGEKGVPFEVSKGSTLMSLLIKPYTWWTAPPTFNVIFPSQYKTFSFGRDFMAEPTRLIMSAFGVLESLVQPDLEKFAPSHFMFLAPTPLAKKFEQEASDSKTKRTIKTLETEIVTLVNQRDKASVSLAVDSTLNQQQKIALQGQVKSLDAQIVQKEAELVSAVKSADTGNVTSLDTSGKKKVQVSAGLWNRSILTAADGVASASREDIKGIVFAFDYIGQTQVEVSKAKNVDPNALKTYMSNVANYKLALQQHKDRMSQVSMEFSPQLVCGFPALVVDPHRNFFGELDSVTHILDANGLANTEIQMSFIRTDEVEFSERERNVPGKIAFPRWINERYLPNQIGDQVYKVLFPENRPDKSKPGIKAADSILAYDTSSTRTQIEAGRVIRKLYNASKDKERFALGFTRRNIASIDQTLGILGAKRQGNTFVFTALSGDRFRAALEYSAAAFKVATAIASDTTEEGNRPRTSVSTGTVAVGATTPAKSSSARVAEATADGAKDLEMRSAAKSLKLETVTRFAPPALIPPSGTVRSTRSSDGKILTSTYEDSENKLVDVITVASESGSEIKYSARGDYFVKLPNIAEPATLAAADITGSFGLADGAVTRDNAFLNGLQRVNAAVLAKYKKSR
jgi:hypothetical protein